MINCVVFVPLTANQTYFYIEIAKLIKNKHQDCVFLSFHENSHKRIAEAGFENYSPYPYGNTKKNEGDITLHLNNNINFNKYIFHEKVFYEEYNSKKLVEKFKSHSYSVGRILDIVNEKYDKITIVQELGGFLSVLSVFLEALKRNFDNIFIEPSFFRGRVFFLKNTLKAPSIPMENACETEVVKAYLKDTASSGSIVIPAKDRMAYRNVIQKVFNTHNVKRLIQKLYSKYILKQKEEFEHILVYVQKHLRMIYNRYRMTNLYNDIPEKPFFYYPFHVPDDFALTIRSPEHYDQLSLVSHIARNIPFGAVLCVKEHPARIGALDRLRLTKLLRQNDNIILLNPGINNYRIFESCKGVITVNSKSGAEAAMVGKPVACLGDAFYKDSTIVQNISKLSELDGFFNDVFHGNFVNSPETKIINYFQNVWDKSYPGELFELDKGNVILFADSLTQVIDSAL